MEFTVPTEKFFLFLNLLYNKQLPDPEAPSDAPGKIESHSYIFIKKWKEKK